VLETSKSNWFRFKTSQESYGAATVVMGVLQYMEAVAIAETLVKRSSKFVLTNTGSLQQQMDPVLSDNTRLKF
jgi:hypothetical protein